MKKINIYIFLIGFLILNSVSHQSLMAADFKINGEYRINDYLYDELDHFYGPLNKRSNYYLQKATVNTVVKEGMTTGVVQFYLNNLNQNNQPTGGYIWGSSGGYSSNIPMDPLIHQAYLEIPIPVGTVSAGRKLIKLGHGIILNDTSDNLFLNLPLSIFNLDLAYLKLIEPDSVNEGNNNDYDKNGYIINLNVTLNDTDSLGLFYAEEKQKATGLMISDTNVLVFGITGSGKAGDIDWTAEFDSLSGHDGDFRVDLPRVGNNLYLSGSTKLNFGRLGLELLRIQGKKSTAETSYNSLAGDFIGGHGILLNDQTRFGGGINLNQGMADMGDPTGYWSRLSHNFLLFKGFVLFNPYKKITISMELFPYVTVIDRGVLGLTHEKIGIEGNVTGSYPIDDHLKLSAGTAYFKAGDVLREIASITNTPSVGKNVIKSYLSLSYLF